MSAGRARPKNSSAIETMLEVTDDSGFLALVVPATYETFVASDWSFYQILAHFKAQMARRSLLIFGTGLEGFWKVDVVRKRVTVKGFREVLGAIEVAGGALLLTNYESLTMAAQFKDVKLPEKHQKDLVVSIPDGNYSCRIVQMFDPDREASAGDDKPNFVIDVVKASSKIAAWESIPWFNS
jgi:hypothetical protein